MGIDISIASSKNYFPENKFVDKAKSIAKNSGSQITITENINDAILNADVIYTDVWVSMGEENKDGIAEKIKELQKYQVNKSVMQATGKTDTIFLHCLPATHKDEVHNMEVTEDVFESPNSFVFQQGENRLHTIKAILISTIGEQR